MASNEETNAAGTDTRPPMLVENDYESWKIRIHRYIRGKPNGKLIWKSIQNGPTPHPMVTDPPPANSTVMPAPRKKLDSEFNDEENKLEMADTQAEIILSQGLPRHIFNILNQTSTAKEIWDNVEMLMQGSGRTLQQRKEDLFDEYERFRAIGNESIHDYFVRFHKLVNDMKITQLEIPTHQMNTKFVNNLPAYWGKYVTNVNRTWISQLHLMFKIYTISNAIEPHAKKTLKKQEQSTSIVDPLAYVAHTTSAPVLSSSSTSSPQPTAQSPNDALMATMTQIANLLSGFQKQFPPTNNQLRTSSNSRTHATVLWSHCLLETNSRESSRQCKEPKRKMDSQYFKDKALLMEAKEKGDVLDAEAEAFLADVECPNAAVALWPTCHHLNQEMHQGEHLGLDAETVIDDNRSKRKSIAFLQSEKEKIFSEKKDLADSYLDEIVCLKNANKVARDMLQRFNMPTQTIPMLSKKPKAATADLHKALLGIIKERTTQKPDYVSEWCFDYAKQFVEQQLSVLIKRYLLYVLTSDIVALVRIALRDLDLHAIGGKTHKVLELEAECIDTSSASNAIFEINKLRDQLQGKDTTIRNLDAQINIMKVLNVGSTEGSCDQQALETDRIQLKDTITSLRIQLDGLKVENVSLKRRYDELSKANTHSRTAYTEKINALTAEIAKLKTELSGKKSGGSTASEKPKVLASGMYTKSSKSKGRTVADSIAARLTRPTAYKFKTDCSIIPVWHSAQSSEESCLLQILKVYNDWMKETSSKLFKIHIRYEHLRLKISVGKSK
ncbi:hypothetical protein Tco_0695783 [Tanacetum coccineum]